MHVAFISMGAVGHVLASLPFVGELVKRGVRVSYFTAEHLRGQVAVSGADFYPVDSSLTNKGKADENIAENIVAELPLRFLSEAEVSVGQILAVLENDVPDLIVNDTMALSGRLTASYLDVPRIQFFTSYAANDHFSSCMHWPKELEETEPRKKALALATELQKKYKGNLLTTEEIFAGSGEYNIVTVEKSFQPAQETFGDNFFFAGAQIAERAYDGDWVPPTNGKPLLYTSLGTLFNHWPGFYTMLFQAVKDMDINVLCSIGNTLKKEDLGEIPANVQLYEFLPQLEVLKHTSAFVSHAGIGSVMEAAWYGVPTCCIPQMDEQFITAQRVLELKVGTAFLDKDALTSDMLKAGIEDVLSNQEYRANIEVIRKNMQENGGFVKAADAALDFLKRKTGKTL